MATTQTTQSTEQLSTISLSGPRFWLHVEGLAMLSAAIYLYTQRGSSWWLFAALILAPDLAMVAYLVNPRVGSIMYNLAHTYVLPLVLLLSAHYAGQPLLWAIGLIWLAHIGVDRLAGYGLKYSIGFKATHLDRV